MDKKDVKLVNELIKSERKKFIQSIIIADMIVGDLSEIKENIKKKT